MKAFLTMKHWQLFLLLWGFPMFAGFALMVALIAGGMFNEWIIIAIALINIFSFAILVSWQYTLVYSLNKLMPDGEKLNLTLFNICVIVPIILLGIIFTSLYTIFKEGVTDPELFMQSFLSWFLIIMLLAMVSLAASIYVLYQMSKALVTVEQQRHVVFSDFLLEFILFWFWIVGIWIIQPRINAIFGSSSGSSMTPVSPPPLPG